MKHLLNFSLILIAVSLASPAGAQVPPGNPATTPSGFDLCYRDMRDRFASPEKAATTCRGVISSSCYLDARGPFGRVEYAVRLCQGFISNLCYEDARQNYRSIAEAASICQIIPKNP